MAGSSCEHYFIKYQFSLFRIFFQIVIEYVTEYLLYGTGDFIVAEFGFGLSFKLWLGYFDRYDTCEPFAKVVAHDLHLQLFEKFIFLTVAFECTCERASESRYVCTAFERVYVIDIGENILAV